MKNLEKYLEEYDLVALEDIDIVCGNEFHNQRNASLEANLDAYAEAIETSCEELADIEDRLKGDDELSLEQRREIRTVINDYSNLLDLGVESNISLEALDDVEQFTTASMESVTDIIGRLIQVYANLFKGILDDVGRVFTDKEKRLYKLKERLSDTKRTWDKKRKDLKTKTILSSYAGQDIYLAFTKNNKMSESPLQAINEDRKMSAAVLIDYQKDISAYINKFADIVSGGDYTSDDTFIDSVLEKIGAMGNPVDVFDKKLLTQNPVLLANCSWETKKPKAPKLKGYDDKASSYIKAATKHQIQINYNNFETLTNTAGQVFVDIKYSPDDFDKLLDELLGYCDDAISFAANRKEIINSHKRMLEAMKRTRKSAKGDVNKKLLSQLVAFSKYVSKQQIKPAKDEVGRVLFVISRASIYAKRVAKRND